MVRKGKAFLSCKTSKRSWTVYYESHKHSRMHVGACLYTSVFLKTINYFFLHSYKVLTTRRGNMFQGQ